MAVLRSEMGYRKWQDLKWQAEPQHFPNPQEAGLGEEWLRDCQEGINKGHPTEFCWITRVRKTDFKFRYATETDILSILLLVTSNLRKCKNSIITNRYPLNSNYAADFAGFKKCLDLGWHQERETGQCEKEVWEDNDSCSTLMLKEGRARWAISLWQRSQEMHRSKHFRISNKYSAGLSGTDSFFFENLPR